MTLLDLCPDCGHYQGNHRDTGCIKCDCTTPLHLSPLEGEGQARSTDPATSKAAAETNIGRKTSARYQLLAIHFEARHSPGMTDEQAARAAGLSLGSEYATRCSELRRAGYLEETGETRRGASGAERMVSRITDKGRAVLSSQQSKAS